MKFSAAEAPSVPITLWVRTVFLALEIADCAVMLWSASPAPLIKEINATHRNTPKSIKKVPNTKRVRQSLKKLDMRFAKVSSFSSASRLASCWRWVSF